jgi:hypothetical protein
VPACFAATLWHPPHCIPAAEQQQLRGQRTANSSRLAAPPLLEAFAQLMGALLPQARFEAEASAAEGAGEWLGGWVGGWVGSWAVGMMGS